MPGPVLAQVNLVVRDMEAAVGFYRRLGVEVSDPPPPWGGHHRNAHGPAGIDLDLDSTEFAEQWGWDQPGVLMSFRFEQRDEVDAAYAELTAAGYEGRKEPFDAFWGARFAIVLDPDGNGVGLTSPVDRSLGGPPPPIT